MNKIIKTMGMISVISGIMYTNAEITQRCKDSKDPTVQETLCKGNLDNTISNNKQLWGTLMGLGILGLTAAFGKKIKDKHNVPYDKTHTIIDKVCLEINQNSNNEEKLKHIENTEQLFKILLIKHSNGDIKAAQQFILTLGALKHAVENNIELDKDINIKLRYLFDKATTNKIKFAGIDKEYRAGFPTVNFDRNYGVVKIIKNIEYKNHPEPLVYSGMKPLDAMRELHFMESIINDKNNIHFYKQDELDLKEKIKLAEDYIQKKMTLPSALLNEISQIYKLKQICITVQL